MTAYPPNRNKLAPAGATASLVALACIVLAPTASAADVHLAIEAREMMMNCPDGKMMCLVVTQGSLDDLKPGASGTITFTNKGTAAHELKLIPASSADGAHQATGEDQAFATSAEDMEAGASDTFNFTVPATVSGVYLFCHVSGHEASGMWLASAATTTTSPKGSPVPFSIGLVAIALAGLLAVRVNRHKMPGKGR